MFTYEIPYNMLAYNKTNRSYTAFISDFGPSYKLQQIMELVSPKTANVAKFKYIGSSYDRDGDVTSFNYYCSEYDLKMVIFND